MLRIVLTRGSRRKTIGLILLVAAVLAGTYVFVVRGPDLKRQREWGSQSQNVYSPAFAPNGKTLVTGGDDPIRVWNPKTTVLRASLSTYNAAAFNPTFSPNGDLLACSRLHRERKQPDRITLELGI